MKKNTYTILELIFVISILFISLSLIKVNTLNNDLTKAKKNILLSLKLIRYQSLIDNQYNDFDNTWFKKQWTLKFRRCSKNIGGFYYLLYSDKNKTGHVNVSETLKDPLSNKYLFSTWRCEKTQNNSKYILLTKEFNIKKIEISCNNTKSLGQFSFSYDGHVLNSLSNESKKNIINKDCYIKLIHKNNKTISITINKNGYAF